MENDAVKVYEEAGIEVVDGKTPKKAVAQIPDEVFVPAPTTDDVINQEKTSHERNFLQCCCCCPQSDSIDLEPAGSTALFQQENMHHFRLKKGCRHETKSFLDSAAYYVFVIVLTFVITIFLFVELFIDAGLLHVALPSDATADDVEQNEQETYNISTALHWFSFAVLCLFLIEVIIRIAVWRSKLVRDIVSIFDCVISFIAFLSNLCVTLVVGSHSPIDGISLIIVLRLIRIYSMVKARVRIVKKQAKFQLKETESELAIANNTVSGLRRQIMDKDFEIKQLHAYLGGGTVDPLLNEAIKASKQDVGGKGAAADKDLEMAIALSKREFNKENGIIDGELNRAFSNSESTEDNYGVLVHTNPKRSDRLSSSGTHMTSFIEEYFSKNSLSPAKTTSEGVSPGARRKNKQTMLDITPVENDLVLNPHDDTALVILPTTNQEPVSICVDPDILLCDEKRNHHDNIEGSGSSDDRSDPMGQEGQPIGGDQPTGTDDPAGDVVRTSSPDLPSDGENNKETEKSKVKAWIKNSGSSLGSESGYQSEDLSHNTNGKLAIPADAALNSDGIHPTPMELTAL